MSLFSKPKIAIWPKTNTVDIFLDKKDNNNLTFDINLWEERSETELQPLFVFLKQNRIDSCSVLVPDDVVLTKSFIYDSNITQIEKKEVIGLAESFVHFKIDPEAIDYKLVSGDNKTIIQSIIFDTKKLNILNRNLSILGIKVNTFRPISASISSIISKYYSQEYFLIYPLNATEYTLILAKGDSVYLTATVKGPHLDIQKNINYSNLYFTNPTNKFYLPSNRELEIATTTQLEKTSYNDGQIASELKKASNLPLPVLGLFVDENNTTTKASSAIINKPQDLPVSNINLTQKPTMENKKNLLPIIAVFLFTAFLASVIIWFVLNRNNNESNLESTTPIVETTPIIEPTAIPTPVIAELDKTIKIQVLNATEINGQAATVKEMLTKLGFTNVTVGNGKEKVTENEVRMKSTLTDGAAYFESKLATTFPATYSSTLTGSFDAVFIIGTDLSTGAAAPVSETPVKTTVTPTKAATSSAKVTVTPTKSATATATPTTKVTPTPTKAL